MNGKQSMLRGHESLIRLVGKRRKYVPAFVPDDSVDSSCASVFSRAPELSVACCVEEYSHWMKREALPASSLKLNQQLSCDEAAAGVPVEWVLCPVCSKSIRDSAINSHLDICLQGHRQNKRKSKQLTLTQFRMAIVQKIATPVQQERSSVIMGQDTSIEEQPRVGNGAVAPPVPSAWQAIKCSSDKASLTGISKSAGQEYAGYTFDCGNPEVVAKHTNEVPAENSLNRCSFQMPEKVCLCACHSCPRSYGGSNERVPSEIEGEVIIDLTVEDRKASKEAYNHAERVGVLETHIVGRKFHKETICKVGMEVTLLRDPDNPKDSNAIKIVPLESPTGPALGYLRREISLHMSAILDKGLMDIKGSVTASPSQYVEPVPIKLFCESKSLNNLTDPVEKEDLASSWHKVLLAAEKNFHQQGGSSSLRKAQQNFLYLLQTVLERDEHLFNEDEKKFLGSFSSISGDAQRLFIHLYQRRGPWFRISDIDYKDVGDVKSASEVLLCVGFMTQADSLQESYEVAIRKRIELLSVVELRQLLCRLLLKKKSEVANMKREELINLAVSASVQKDKTAYHLGSSVGSTLVQFLLEINGTCVRVSEDADMLMWRLQRLFFLNGEQDLSAFLLVDMGLLKYPIYKCHRSRHIFPTRGALLSYEKALGVAQGTVVALEENDIETALSFLDQARLGLKSQLDSIGDSQELSNCSQYFLARFSAAYVYKSVCTLGVSILEREHRYSEAIEVLRQLLCSKYRSGRWGYWTLRLSLDLEHLGRKEESLQVAELGADDPWIRGGDRVALQRRVVRLGKPPRRWRKPAYAEALKVKCNEVRITGRPLNVTTGVKSRFYGYDGQQCGVEELALQFYALEENGGWNGVHSEGSVWMTLFGLLMWDVLFTAIPDVFQTPFQTAPLDLDTDAFSLARRTIIEDHLGAISQGKAKELLSQTWAKYHGTFCRGVNWERHSLLELQTIAACIGGLGLSAICRLLAEDYAGWTAGMPDLLLWRTFSAVKDESTKECTDCMVCHKCNCHLGCMPSERCQGSEVGETELCCSVDPYAQDPSTNCINKFNNVPDWIKGEAKLVEVKGPRDRLSEQQRAWIWILMNAGLTVEVCKVIEHE